MKHKYKKSAIRKWNTNIKGNIDNTRLENEAQKQRLGDIKKQKANFILAYVIITSNSMNPTRQKVYSGKGE